MSTPNYDLPLPDKSTLIHQYPDMLADSNRRIDQALLSAAAGVPSDRLDNAVAGLVSNENAATHQAVRDLIDEHGGGGGGLNMPWQPAEFWPPMTMAPDGWGSDQPRFCVRNGIAFFRGIMAPTMRPNHIGQYLCALPKEFGGSETQPPPVFHDMQAIPMTGTIVRRSDGQEWSAHIYADTLGRDPFYGIEERRWLLFMGGNHDIPDLSETSWYVRFDLSFPVF